MPWEHLLMQSAPGADDDTVFLARNDVQSPVPAASVPVSDPFMTDQSVPFPAPVAAKPPVAP